MLAKFNNLGSVGIVKDTDPYLLPPNAWTDGENIRFYNNEVSKISGSSSQFDTSITDTKFIVPTIKWISSVPTLNWVYAGKTKVYATEDGVTHTNITRQVTGSDDDYTLDDGDSWTACHNQNILIMNNGKDSPQVWIPDTADLQNLPWVTGTSTWDSLGYTTQAIRSYKNFLIALQFKEGTSATNNPTMLAWSHPAEPFTAPSSWDYSDPTKLAGLQELSSTPGYIIDALKLRDYMIIYKDDAIINMAYTGGVYVFAFRDISSIFGLLSKNSVVEFFGKHFAVSNDDIIVHDGMNIESVLTDKLKREIFNNIDTTYYANSFVVPNYNKDEIWFCYPESGYSSCTKAAIWNYKTSAWSFRSLPSVNFISNGIAVVGDSTWDADSDTWDSDSTEWDSRSYNPTVRKLLGTTTTNVAEYDSGYTCCGTSYTSSITKEGISLGEQDMIKRVKSVYVKGKGAMNVYVGATMNQNDAVIWEGPFAIVPETDAQIRCRVTGRYHAIKFEFVGDYAHSIQEYVMEFVPTGQGR
jgi:hypothetical protein